MKIQGEIVGGKLKIDRSLIARSVLDLGDCKVTLEIKKFKSSRSLRQNAYYHGVVVQVLSDHTGEEPKMMHEILKAKFLSVEAPESAQTLSEFVEIPHFRIVRSTTDLNTKEFEEFMEEVRRWASMKLGCWIPEPHESEFGY